MRTSRILTVLFALLLALSSLTSGTPIAAAEELGPTSIAVDSNNVAAVSRMQAISTDETNAYVDDAYGFSLRVPDTWHIRPASAERLGSVTQISNVAMDELGSDSDTTGIIKLEVGVFTYDKPLDTPITEWTKSGDNLPQTEPVDHEITIADQDALRRDFQSDLWSGSMIMVPYGTKVYFVSITPLSSLTDRDVVTMLDSFKIVTPFEMDQPLVENLYKGPTSSSLVESTDEASQITATAGYRLPFVGTYRITAGPGCYDTHVNRSAEAIDFGLGLDTPVYTTNSGTIVFAVYGTPDNDYNDGFGNLMKVQHQDGKISWYAHLNSFTKTSGSISQEEQIAYSGNTGNVTGPHLHFEIRDGTNYSISIRDLPGITWYNGNPANPCIDGDDGIAVGPPVSGGTSCAAPHLTSPDNGATVDSRTVTFHWDAPDCPGLTGYTIHVTTGSGPEDGIILDSAASLTEYSYTFPSDGTYYWHVAAWSNGTVRGPWADYRIVVSTSTPVNQWSARYYDNETCWNDPGCDQSCRCKETIDGPELHKDWGTGAPCGGMATDNWVADYRATIHFSPGYYIFNLDHDDGAKLWVDGDLIADRSGKASGPVCGDGGYYLSGDTEVRVILHEESGDAKINLSWTTDMSACNPAPSAPSLISPANGATFNENDAITLSWSDTGDDFYGEVWGGPAGTSPLSWQTATSRNIGTQWAGYTYSWHVRARNSGGTSDWSPTRTFTVRPATPTGLSAQASACNRVNLTWTDNSGNEEGYRIYCGSAGIGTVGANVTSYTDDAVSENTAYSYTVRAYRSDIESSASNSASVTTPACCVPSDVPPRPTIISPTNGEVLHTTEPTLQWSDLTQCCLDFYNLQVYDASGTTIINIWPHTPTYTVPASILIEGEAYEWAVWGHNALGFGEGIRGAFTVAGQLPLAPTLLTPADMSVFTEGDPVEFTWSAVDAESYRIYLYLAGVNYQPSVSQPSISFDTGLWAGMGTWHVQAINAAGTSPDSSYRTFFIRPAVPTDLAVEIVSDHRADLTWTDNSGWESGTRVFRDGVAIGTVGAGLTSFSDTTFDPGISYTYYVRSYATDDLESVDSNWVTIYLPDIPSAPTLTAPANGATFEEGQAISLQWTDAGDDFYGEVWGGPSGTVPFGWQASTAYNLNSQPAGYIYSWHVRARNAAGTGDWSATRAFTIRPVAPGDLSVVPVSSSLVSLTWLDNSASEEGYYVYRGGTLVATLPAGSTSYDDTGANGNTTYTYTVRAYRGTVTSLSATASVLTLPAAPGINGPADGYDASEALSVQLRWSVSGDEYSGELWGGPEGTITFGWQTGLSYEVSEKSVGATYSWHVRARNASGMSDWSPTRTFIVRPNNPTLLATRAASCHQVVLSWKDNSASEQGFRIYRDGVAIATVPADIVTYTDDAVSGSTSYAYAVRTYYGDVESAVASTSTATTPACPVPPAAPTLLSPADGATFDEGATISLSWSGDGDDYYGEIWRDGEGQTVALGWQTATSRNISDLSAGYTYSWHIRARNAAGTSDWSTTRTFTVRPAAPTYLVADAVACNRVDLTWTDEATTEEGYYVYRSGTLIATLPSGSWSYSDTGASGDTTYTYTVRAYFGSVTSLAATVSVTTPACVTPVVAPTPVSPANGVTFDEGTAVTLSWSGDGDDYYGEVWGGPDGTVTFGWQTATSHDLGVQSAGYTYSWHVRARNAAGTSDWSSVRTFTVRLAAPTGLNAIPATSGAVDLTWTDNSTDEEGYSVYRGGLLIASLPADSSSYEDTGASANTAYTYRVYAYHASTNSLAAAADVLTVPAAPVARGPIDGYHADELQSISMSWSATGNEYYGEVWGGPEGTTTFGWQPGLSYELTPTGVGCVYSWHVRARNASGPGAWNPTRTITVHPGYPTQLSIPTSTCSQIVLNWADNSASEQGFRIYRNGTAIATVPANITTYTDDTVSPSTTYTYGVRSYLGTVESNVATEFRTTTPTCALPPAVPILSSPANGATFDEDSTVTLSWSGDGDDYYGEIWRDGEGQTVALGWQTATSRNVSGLSAGYTYSWHIRARNTAGTSDWSTTRTFTVRPAAPTYLAADAVACNRVDLTWTDEAATEEGYYVYRSGTLIATLPSGSWSYSDTGASGDTTYTYTVRAYFGSVTSLAATVSVTTPACATPPAAPTLTSPANDAAFSEYVPIVLSWSASGAEYEGEISGGPHGTATFGWQAGNSYNAGALPVGYTYAWHVRARNAVGTSGWSTTRSFTVRPLAPTDLVARGETCSRVYITWVDASTQEQGYYIYRNGTLIATLAANKASYTDSGVSENTTYTYTICAYYDAITSAASTVAATTPKCDVVPAAPTLLSPGNGAVLDEGEEVIFTCSNVGAEHYRFFLSLGGRDYDQYVEQPTLTLESSTLWVGTGTWYVRAYNGFTAGPDSASRTLTVRPAVPTELQAHMISDTEIDLSWQDRSQYETGVRIYRDGVAIGTAPAGATNYADLTVMPGRSYTYYVCAYQAGIESAKSTSARVSIGAPPSDNHLYLPYIACRN